jgi:hypothetical protein
MCFTKVGELVPGDEVKMIVTVQVEMTLSISDDEGFKQDDNFYEIAQEIVQDCLQNNSSDIKFLEVRKENEKSQIKDRLHQLNSLIRDYCVKRDFRKRFPIDEWFEVQTLSRGTDYRALLVLPLVKDSFFERKLFEDKTTQEVFDKAFDFYSKKVE